MRKFICLFLTILLSFALLGCTNTKDIDIDITSSAYDVNAYFNTFFDFYHTFDEPIKDEKNYKILNSDEHAGDVYKIYDNYGNVLDIGYHEYRGSFEIKQDGDIVLLEYGWGGTNTYPTLRLYDVANCKISRYFQGPAATNNELVAFYIDNEDGQTVLAVQDAFDRDKFYKEFDDTPFDTIVWLWTDSIYFSEDGTKVTVVLYEFIQDDIKYTEYVFNLK